MEKSNLQNRFRGQARLVRLLLWKIGESTDVSVCLDVAASLGMIDEEDATFLKNCLDSEERDRDSGELSIDITSDDISHLQRCADKLNRADSA